MKISGDLESAELKEERFWKSEVLEERLEKEKVTREMRRLTGVRRLGKVKQGEGVSKRTKR